MGSDPSEDHPQPRTTATPVPETGPFLAPSAAPASSATHINDLLPERSSSPPRDQHASSPPSPRIGPYLPPQGSSAISSLAASTSGDSNKGPLAPHAIPSSSSQGVLGSASQGTEPSAAGFEAQTLMQMLSIVGSRLMEADQLGLTDAQCHEDEFASQGEDEGRQNEEQQGARMNDSPAEESSASTPAQAESPVPRSSQRRRGIMSALLDPDATPTGGSTPLGGSLLIGPRAGRTLPPNPQRLQPQRALSPAFASDAESDADESSSEEETGILDDEAVGVINTNAMTSSLHSLSEPVQETMPSSSSASALPELRRQQLTEKLQAIFSLPLTEEVQTCCTCWLYRSVLLQGHLYLTTGHALFYAYLPSREDGIVKAGALRKRTQKTYRFSRHWAVLRGRALSWYDSARDPYFPQDHIDLRSVIAVKSAPKQQCQFRIHTPNRIFIFEVDSETSRDDWVQALQKAVFRAQNEGDSVRISIPLEAIVDVENTNSSGSEDTDMVCLQVVDTASANFALDEYYFLNFDRQADFVRSLKSLIEEHSQGITARTSQLPPSIRDSTSGVQRLVGDAMSPLAGDDIPSLPSIDPRKESGASLLSQELKKDSSNSNDDCLGTVPAAEAITIPVQAHTTPASSEDPLLSATPRASDISLSATFKASDSSRWGYPPSPPSRAPPPGLESSHRGSGQAWPVPRWVKDAPGRLMPGGSARSRLTSLLNAKGGPLRPVKEVWSSRPLAAPSPQQEEQDDLDLTQNLSVSQSSSFSMLDTPQLAETEEEKRQLMVTHFATTFSLPREDELICDLEVCLYRVLPVTGRLFISSKHLCFRSSNLATKTIGKTKMILPFQEIVSCAVHPAFRYGWHGLVTMVRGHEEIFFEFGSKDKRDHCLRQIEARIEARHDVKVSRAVSSDASQQERQDALILTDLTAKANELSLGESISSLASSSSGSDFQQDGSLLSFKPNQSMHFTILTIGSRGDVQPFLALSKGLIAEGHRVRMATHAEFGPWIQQHGVDFVEIGGDPAELMKICVENGTFTVSFLREGVTKFRGWLDELLVSCWHACQGTDVIIESPNAIAGIHISEALQVPYFRAFTMPWSRTRAYPQAFAVPNKKAGGNYNYMTYVIFDQVLWTASAGQINRWRASCLGLLPTNLDKLEQHKTPFLYNFSPSLVPKPLDWYDWIHVTGFWFLDNPENSSSKAWSPPEELLAFIARARKLGKKLVYIGWGSITVPNAAATTRCVTEAVRMSNVCAILSKGWSDRLTKKAGAAESVAMNASPYLTDDVFQVNSVPHDWLFPQMDAACHHGGAGTLGASLRAGIPTIVKPFFGDQFFWGQQVESLGVGSCVRDLTIDALSNALVQATQSVRQIERARELGRQIRGENGVAEAIRAIYADLDYARSLIKKNTRSSRTTAEGGTAMQRGHSRSLSTTAASSPSGLSSPSGARSFSPGSAAASQRGRTPFGAPQGPNRSRANSGHTTSDEWSVVSGSEEDEERRAALAD